MTTHEYAGLGISVYTARAKDCAMVTARVRTRVQVKLRARAGPTVSTRSSLGLELAPLLALGQA